MARPQAKTATPQLGQRPSAPTQQGTAPAADFVRAMRAVVSGVAIITTIHESRPWGMTVSAFTTVCAEPPTLMVCINTRTVLAAALQGADSFGVNVLSQDQEFLSRLCARPGTLKFLEQYLELDAGDPGQPTAPLLPQSVAAFDCRLTDARTVGTHLVVMGMVRRCLTSDRAPLLYGSGNYQFPTREAAPTRALQGALAWA